MEKVGEAFAAWRKMNCALVSIPTNESFLVQWHTWIHSKVSRNFKRDKERIFDTVQNVRLRLLQKDFIGRWFFKHLREELVDRVQAERILGGAQLTFIGHVKPVSIPNSACKADNCAVRRSRGLGCSRSCPNSLWRVSDLLAHARFDYGRYYYSAQSHTIGSDRALELLGYPPGSYSILESLYRQGRLRPSELTEHACSGLAKCAECEHGRSLLRSRGLSLASRWSDRPTLAAKLRWNDSQIIPFLRRWNRQNLVHATPLYIMRQPDDKGRVLGIDAGLLKYAEIIINNEVVNDFKRLGRSDDMGRSVFNKGVSPELSNGDLVAFESDEEDGKPRKTFRDSRSMSGYDSFEHRRDVKAIMDDAGLTEEERDAIMSVELMEMTVRQYSDRTGTPIPRVHRVRASAMRKLRGDPGMADLVARDVCNHHGIAVDDLSGPGLSGTCVLARTDAFSILHDRGMSVLAIAEHFRCPEARVVAAINRMCLREMRVPE